MGCAHSPLPGLLASSSLCLALLVVPLPTGALTNCVLRPHVVTGDHRWAWALDSPDQRSTAVLSTTPVSSSRSFRHRARVCGAVGLAVGAFYSFVAILIDAYPTAGMVRRGWAGLEPTAAETFAPVAGGLLMGFLVALLWPAVARKDTAIAAGIVAALPFGLGIVISLTGAGALSAREFGIGALVSTLVIGMPLGAFMYDYNR